jgi:hypothetical protein
VVGAPFAGLVLTSTPPPVSIVSDGRGINRQTAAKAASPQNGADRGLDDAQIDRNLVLRLALFAQRLDLGDQALVDNLRSRNRKASRPAPFRCVNCNRLVVSRGSLSIVTHQTGRGKPRSRVAFIFSRSPTPTTPGPPTLPSPSRRSFLFRHYARIEPGNGKASADVSPPPSAIAPTT